jgi:hypothetical protein
VKNRSDWKNTADGGDFDNYSRSVGAFADQESRVRTLRIGPFLVVFIPIRRAGYDRD